MVHLLYISSLGLLPLLDVSYDLICENEFSIYSIFVLQSDLPCGLHGSNLMNTFKSERIVFFSKLYVNNDIP